MPRQFDPPCISSKESPREILAGDYKSLRELPIHGGWGYTIEDAVIIDKDDPIVPRGVPFNGIGIEYVFVEYRTYEELIVFRPKNDRYCGIKRNLLGQKLITEKDGRSYDVLSFEITALPEKDWEELKAEWDSMFSLPGFDVDAHNKKRDERMICYVTECWFDITSFFGSGSSKVTETQPDGYLILPVETNNSKLINRKNGVFSVLGLVSLGLFGPYTWRVEDVEEEMAKGTIFSAFRPEDQKEGGISVAHFYVVDGTSDPTWPDVSELEQTDIPSLV